MKYFLKLVLIFGVLPNIGYSNTVLSNIPCQEQVFSLLLSWGHEYSWSQGVNFNQTKTLKSPTDKIGNWVYMTAAPSSTIITKDTVELRQTFEFELPQCVAKVESTLKQEVTNNGFTDEKLQTLLEESKKKNTSGIIYLWSPHMTLSVTGAQEVKKLSKELGIGLTLVHDSRAELEPLRRASISQSQVMNSRDLSNRGFETHFPSLIFYQNGELERYPRPGYDNYERLKEVVSSKL
ncbi:MAG: hypothetical protein CME65_02990 [Halobacteriovoraceae bacterium]|nr:hypothetical protein [Halobacteriovoraceae bacterium]|tara:strand:+ start:9741 stop:10448 length:708 start_codon:yes stop_codon:yes gene_type:complete